MPVPTISSGTFAAADVYRNLLHKRVSIRSGGKVVAHANCVVMTNVKFVVMAGKLARIRRLGQREVAAYVRGDVTVLAEPPKLPANAKRVCFDPFKHASFVLEDGTPVAAADQFIMTAPCGSWVVGPR